MTDRTVSFEVESSAAGQRVDAFLAGRPELGLTRSQAERLAKAGQVLVNGRPVPPGRRLAAGEKIAVTLPHIPAAEAVPAPEPRPLDIFFEDEHLLVVNKPRGLVVHPGAGRPSGTLVNALLAHTKTLASGSTPFRPGIVHRLDRDTSGLLVVAKSDLAYADLSRQVRERKLDRRYLALVWGNIHEDYLLIDLPIGRHLQDRKRMAAVSQPAPGRKLRSAQTHVTVVRRFGAMTLVEVKLVTGRTHQIRVHLAHEGHPVVGDRTYGRRRAQREHAVLPAKMLSLLQNLKGQALHAYRLSFRHPVGGQDLAFSAPAPADMAAILSHLGAREP
jgi:23S rRNA pseudouridine1911/1915/1917 synthase